MAFDLMTFDVYMIAAFKNSLFGGECNLAHSVSQHQRRRYFRFSDNMSGRIDVHEKSL